MNFVLTAVQRKALSEEVRDGYADDPRDTQQHLQRRVSLAGLDLLIEAPRQRHSEEHGLLGEVVIYPRVPDAPADAAPLAQQPVIVVGEVAEHSTNALATLIISQPGETGPFLISIAAAAALRAP